MIRKIYLYLKLVLVIIAIVFMYIIKGIKVPVDYILLKVVDLIDHILITIEKSKRD